MIYLNLDLGPLDTAFDKQFGSALEIQLHSQSAEEMMHLTSLASELRWMLELAFPNAREFIRPGFDQASTLLM